MKGNDHFPRTLRIGILVFDGFEPLGWHRDPETPIRYPQQAAVPATTPNR